MRKFKSSGSGLSVALLVVLIAGTAWAGSDEESKGHYDQAMALYRGGRLEAAIEELQEAYAIKPLPRLVLNIAQLYRKLGRPRDALRFYQAYVAAQPDLRAKERADVERYIAETQAQLEAPAEPKAGPARLEAVPARPQAVSQRRRPLRIAGWTLGGAGLLVLAAGAALWGLNGTQTCERQPGQMLCPERLATLAPGVALVVGGVAAVGSSAVLLGLDYRAGPSGNRVAWLTLAGGF